jgi:hypothetical protein
MLKTSKTIGTIIKDLQNYGLVSTELKPKKLIHSSEDLNLIEEVTPSPGTVYKISEESEPSMGAKTKDYPITTYSGMKHFVGKFPARTELTTLSGDKPSKSIGWSISEDIGIGVVNPRGVAHGSMRTSGSLINQLPKDDCAGLFCYYEGYGECKIVLSVEKGDSKHVSVVAYIYVKSDDSISVHIDNDKFKLRGDGVTKNIVFRIHESLLKNKYFCEKELLRFFLDGCIQALKTATVVED